MEEEKKPEQQLGESEGKEKEESTQEIETSEEVNIKKVTTQELEVAILYHNRAKLKEIFETVPDIDIAAACEELDVKVLIALFRDISSDLSAPLFDELSQDKKEELVKAMTDKELVALISEQFADDAADTIGDMPANLARKVLRAAPKELRADINVLLKYKPDTAGAIMTTEFLELKQGESVKRAISDVRAKGKEAETVFTIFVRNEKRKFVGTVDLDDLIFAEEDQKLMDIMNKDAPSVHASTDKEEVANIIRRYDLNAVAVLNDDDCLIGIVTVDDAVDVLTQENNEDLARVTNMEPTEKPYMEMTIWENAKKCFPWIIGLLILGTFTTMVLNRLEVQQIFQSLPILISFVPTLMDTGGNAGGQTTGMMIRSLAMKEFGPKQTAKVLWREFRSALFIALFVAVFAFFWIALEEYTGIVSLGVVGDPDGTHYNFANYTVWNGLAFNGPLAGEFAVHVFTFAGLVSLTMFAAVSVSKVIGTLLCMGASAIKKDPALLAQPLLTTVMDVTTLLIYFAMACIFFPAFA